MKKKVLLIAFLFSMANIYVVKAQLKMSSDGNFSIAATPNPVSYIKLQNSQTIAIPNTWSYAFVSSITNMHLNGGTGSYCMGVSGSSTFPSPLLYGQSFGVYGTAGNATNGYNYGVFGVVTGSKYGAGIFGASRTRFSYNVGGDWAGFFNGNVKIGTSSADILMVFGTTYTSDQRLKKNIVPLTNTINLISGLNAVEYKFKTRQDLISDGIFPTDTSSGVFQESSNINKTHYGYLAQAVQQVLPELVYVGADSLLAIDYIGLIPLVIEAVKEQNTTIQNQKLAIKDLQEQINKCCNVPINTNKMINDNSNNNDISPAILYQNTPNPFTRETQIKCFIPENSKNASLYFYNMQGAQLRRIIINDKGNQSITIQGSEFSAGMYMYTLIIDGKEIDTKKMILTD
ncbi:MAG: tail fiber domain-containing protein [Bacteroidetes bacterium]|nr:tail fiber domain-containing protein [Bacteroidota bacterium]